MKDTLLRGASRRVVVVKSRDSKLFEEAHFILREEHEADALPDLLEEANRIVEQSRFPKPKRKSKRSGILFAVGLFAGAAIETAGILLCMLFR